MKQNSQKKVLLLDEELKEISFSTSTAIYFSTFSRYT